jgi:hypothetical protein
MKVLRHRELRFGESKEFQIQKNENTEKMKIEGKWININLL